jgi:hypothetical protein
LLENVLIGALYLVLTYRELPRRLPTRYHRNPKSYLQTKPLLALLPFCSTALDPDIPSLYTPQNLFATAMVKHGNHEYLCSEEKRLKEDKERKKYWKKWGPYLSE